MFVAHVKGEQPTVGGLTADRKVIFLAKTVKGDYFAITAPLDFPEEQEKNDSTDLAKSGIRAHMGERTEFSDKPVINGCRISDRCFAHGKDFAFSYHGKDKSKREYSLSGETFEEVYVRM